MVIEAKNLKKRQKQQKHGLAESAQVLKETTVNLIFNNYEADKDNCLPSCTLFFSFHY